MREGLAEGEQMMEAFQLATVERAQQLVRGARRIAGGQQPLEAPEVMIAQLDRPLAQSHERPTVRGQHERRRIEGAEPVE
jgi:hypothetical protein